MSWKTMISYWHTTSYTDEEDCNHEFGTWKIDPSAEPRIEVIGDDRARISYPAQRICKHCTDRDELYVGVGDIEWEWEDPPEWFDFDGRLPKLSECSPLDMEEKERDKD